MQFVEDSDTNTYFFLIITSASVVLVSKSAIYLII